MIGAQYRGGFEHRWKVPFDFLLAAAREQCHDRPVFIEIVTFAEVAPGKCRVCSLCDWIPDISDVLDSDLPVPIRFKRKDREQKIDVLTNRL